MKSDIIAIVVGILIFSGADLPAIAQQKAEDRPNIILMMADDLGWGDVGFNGNDRIRTPYLDLMAEEGILFERFYSASAVCSPTRASVLTGRNPYRTGIFRANNGILRPEEITIAEFLKLQGYMTGHFGKWHLGTMTFTEEDANRGRPGNIKEYNPPAQHGFDRNFSTESKVPTWDPMKKPVRGGGARWNSLEEDMEFEPYGTAYWNESGEKITDNLDGDDSRVIMDRVLPFIDEASEEDTPFFAVVWFHTPHKPCVAGPEYRKLYEVYDQSFQNYAGCITAMDEQVGRLRKFLADKGIDQNTMIWFCSDNGPENGNPGSTGGLRDRKRSLHEGGVRVPGVMVWPDRVKEGFKTSVPCITSDYLPTIIDVLGYQLSWPYELDGTSLVNLIDRKPFQREKPLGFVIGSQTAWIDGNHKLYFDSKEGDVTFFNLAEDRGETNDLSDEICREDMIKHITGLENWVESCNGSFEGKEYGRATANKLDQKWSAPKLPDYREIENK